MDKKTWLSYKLTTRDETQNKRSTQTESEGLEKIFQTNRQEKEKARVAILISDKMAFKTKAIKGDTEGHFIILREESIKKT